MKVKILIFVVRIEAILQGNLIEFLMHNLEHKAPSPEKAGMYQLRMNIEAMGRNDLGMTNQMRYYVKLLSYFFRKNEKFLSVLLMESELFLGLLSRYL